jgi:major membrane immunogen (membrane-anchored lipoprotein)
MKKIVLGLAVMIAAVLMVGCTKVEEGNYKEGTYFGSNAYTSYGKNYVTTAVLYVDDSGMIKSVYIDSTYFKDNAYTTKKVLGDAYGMKSSSAIGKEWYEQVATLESKIVEEQGLTWVKFTDEAKTKTDSVSGVTITIDTYYKAVEQALYKAKK